MWRAWTLMEFNKTLESIHACLGIYLPYLPRNSFCWRSNASARFKCPTSDDGFNVLHVFR